jgi:hypothetical protein
MTIHIEDRAVLTAVHSSHRMALCGERSPRTNFRGEPTCSECRELAGRKRRLSPGDSTHVQFRCSVAVRMALLSRAEAEGLGERAAWEAAAAEWANRR